MNAVSQQTEVRLVFRYCRLGRSELDRIFNLAPEGISAANTVVSTQRDSTRYSAGDLADLVDSLQQSSAPGNLDAWDNLAQTAADAAGDRKVDITMDGQQVVVQVSGRDATWVHGQAARLQLLLEGAGGQREDHEHKLEKDRASFRLTLFIFTMILALAVGSYLADPDYMRTQLTDDAGGRHYGAIAGLLCWLGLFYSGLAVVRRANRALLLPTAEVPQGSWWRRASNADKIAFGGLVVAALALVVAAATLGSDLFGQEEQSPADRKEEITPSPTSR